MNGGVEKLGFRRVHILILSWNIRLDSLYLCRGRISFCAPMHTTHTPLKNLTHNSLYQPFIGCLQLRLLPAPLPRQALCCMPRLVSCLKRNPILPLARLPKLGDLFQRVLQAVSCLLRLPSTALGSFLRLRAPALHGLLVGLEGGNLSRQTRQDKTRQDKTRSTPANRA